MCNGVCLGVGRFCWWRLCWFVWCSLVWYICLVLLLLGYWLCFCLFVFNVWDVLVYLLVVNCGVVIDDYSWVGGNCYCVVGRYGGLCYICVVVGIRVGLVDCGGLDVSCCWGIVVVMVILFWLVCCVVLVCGLDGVCRKSVVCLGWGLDRLLLVGIVRVGCLFSVKVWLVICLVVWYVGFIGVRWCFFFGVIVNFLGVLLLLGLVVGWGWCD